MKKISLLSLLFTVVTSMSILSSCSDSPDMPVQAPGEQPAVEEIDPEVAFYPKAAKNLKSRSQRDGFWEDIQEIYLNGGRLVPTPWNKNGTTSSVPSNILKDIEYDKGWDLIYYPVGSNGRLLMDYLVFHNRYTGILKGFCFYEGGEHNNNAFWQLNFEQPTSAWAFHGETTTFVSKKESDKYVQVNNLSDNPANGFGKGWNCFMVELAYDPTLTGNLKIKPYNENTATITISGTSESETNGEIVSYSTDRDVANGLVKLAGDGATNWVKKKIGEKKFLGISSDVIAKAASSLFTSGVSDLLGGIVGVFSSKDTKTQSVHLTTTGKFSANGVTKFTATGILEELSLNVDPAYVGRLGVWCLNESPKLYFTPYGTYRSPQTYSNGYTREYRSDIVKKQPAKITINPDLLSEIGSYSCNTNFYESDFVKRENGFGGAYADCTSSLLKGTKLYNDLHSPNLYLVANVAFKDKEGLYIPVEYVEAPPEVCLPNVPNGPEGATPNINMRSYYVSAIRVQFTTPAGDIAQSVHTYYPELAWNMDDFNNGLYWYFYPNVPVTILDGYK